MAIGVQTDMATPALARFGSDEVRREFLAPAISGDAVACINGGKMWITNGVQADWIGLLANTSDGPKHRNKSLICAPIMFMGTLRWPPSGKPGWSKTWLRAFAIDLFRPCEERSDEAI
jgi:hypothetical protein